MTNLSSTIALDTFYIEDIDKFIELVEARPALYNKNVKEYGELNVKKKLWEQVCRGIYSFWDSLDSGSKCEGIIRIQKKWMNLRSCFCRELKWQQRVKTGLATNKRRKYIHFEKLLFLTNVVNNTECSETEENYCGNRSTRSIDENDADDNCVESNVESDDNESRNDQTSHKHFRKNTNSNTQLVAECIEDIKPHFEEVEINNFQTGNDEDTYFVLSLVPQLKSLTNDEKFDAKIGMLKIIQDIKRRRKN